MTLLQQLPLPEKFLTFLPLYIGVEAILGIAILNKLSGLYGILSIFTGHPLEFTQWIFYISSILIVPFYAVGFVNILKPKALEFAPIVVIFSVDTITSFLFIVLFAIQWFFVEDTTAEIKPDQDYSKSATQFYEYGWIVSLTVLINLTRGYFNLVIISFYKKLIKFNKTQGIADVNDDENLNLKNQPNWKQLLFKFQYQCYKLLNGTL